LVYLITVIGIFAWIGCGVIGLLVVLRKGYWLQLNGTRALMFARLAILAGPFLLVVSLFVRKSQPSV
jgi:hypothetical protein